MLQMFRKRGKPRRAPEIKAPPTKPRAARIRPNLELKLEPRKKAHIVVFANEKGGVGKSTTAFLTCISLCHAGLKTAAIDLDGRQQSLAKSLNKRARTAQLMEIDFPNPTLLSLAAPNKAGLDRAIFENSGNHDFILIDLAGHDSDIARHAMTVADTLVTPINDSFVDLEVIGHVDPNDLNFTVLAPFSRFIKHSVMERRAGIDQAKTQWIVVPNRLRSIATKNQQKFREVLQDIAGSAGFRVAPGLSERVIYRELAPFGLTLLDLPNIPTLDRAQSSAEQELTHLMRSLRLPTKKPIAAFG